jgi:D-arabinose 1-dehydrogenase-like Zn-dependent alcohol dehydrogenase
MKVFVAGASGALGRQLVPMLVRNGHEVVGMTRSESKRELLARLGARPVVADGLDAEAVGQARHSGSQPPASRRRSVRMNTVLPPSGMNRCLAWKCRRLRSQK